MHMQPPPATVRNFRRYSEAEDALILEGREIGFSYDEIAILLDRPSGRVVKLHHKSTLSSERMVTGNPRTWAPRGKTLRRCLCCREDFASEGPHNRMCEGCRVSAEDVSPYAPN